MGSPTGKTGLKKSKVCSEAWRKLKEEGTGESKSSASGCVPTINHCLSDSDALHHTSLCEHLHFSHAATVQLCFFIVRNTNASFM